MGERAKKLRASLRWAIISTNLVGMPLLAVFVFSILGVVSINLAVDFNRDPLFIPITFVLLLTVAGSFVLIHYIQVIRVLRPAEEYVDFKEARGKKPEETLAAEALFATEKLPYYTMLWSIIYYWIGSPLAVAVINFPYAFSLRQLLLLLIGIIATGMLISVFQFYTSRRALFELQEEILSDFPELLLQNEKAKQVSIIKAGIKTRFMAAMLILSSALVILTAISALNGAFRGVALQYGRLCQKELARNAESLEKMLEAGAGSPEFKALLNGIKIDESDQFLLLDKQGGNLLESPMDAGLARTAEIILHPAGWTVEWRRPSIHTLAPGIFAAVWNRNLNIVVHLPLKNADLFLLSPFNRHTGALKWMYSILLAVMGVGLIPLALLYGRLSAEEIITPLHSLLESMRHMAQGDLARNVLVTGRDELGEVARSLARAIFGLRGLIGRVDSAVGDLDRAVEVIGSRSRDVSKGTEEQVNAVEQTSLLMEEMRSAVQSITDSVQTLASSTEQSSASILQVQATIEEVASNVEALSAAVMETTSSIHQMSSSIKQVAQNVQYLDQQAGEAVLSLREMEKMIGQVSAGSKETESITWQVASDAEQGFRAVEMTIEGMSRIREDSEGVAEVISRLGTRAQEIGNILNVIQDVTDETNLLALNAAIIAAQAGEHGRGFAVVADEIKDLAERTAASTHEIAELIRTVQEDAEKAVERTRAGQTSISEGVKISENAGKALQKIQESVSKAMEHTHAIAQAVMVQNEKAGQIMNFMEGLSSLITEVAKATREQAQNADLIMRAAEKMEEISKMVGRATKEQAQGSRQITQSIEHIAEITQYINSTQTEQLRATEKVKEAVARIKQEADNNQARVQAMTEMMSRVGTMAEELREMLARFKLNA